MTDLTHHATATALLTFAQLAGVWRAASTVERTAIAEVLPPLADVLNGLAVIDHGLAVDPAAETMEGRTPSGEPCTLSVDQTRAARMLLGELTPDETLAEFFSRGRMAGKSTVLTTAAWRDALRAASRLRADDAAAVPDGG